MDVFSSYSTNKGKKYLIWQPKILCEPSFYILTRSKKRKPRKTFAAFSDISIYFKQMMTEIMKNYVKQGDIE